MPCVEVDEHPVLQNTDCSGTWIGYRTEDSAYANCLKFFNSVLLFLLNYSDNLLFLNSCKNFMTLDLSGNWIIPN